MNSLNDHAGSGRPIRSERRSGKAALESDRGLLLGDGLFETVLVRRGVPFRLGRHLDRLREGLGRTGIPEPEKLEEVVAARVGSWIARDETVPEHAALRLTVTRGPGAGLAPPARPTGSLFLSLRIVERLSPRGRPGLVGQMVGRIDEHALSAGLKQIGYLERVLALQTARANGADEAILRNSRGNLVEGSASNLFVVRDGVLRTPEITEGALPGITRQAILELAGEMEIPIVLGAPDPSEPVDELFLTSSIRGPITLVRLDDRDIGPEASVFLRLAEALERLIDRETDTAS